MSVTAKSQDKKTLSSKVVVFPAPPVVEVVTNVAPVTKFEQVAEPLQVLKTASDASDIVPPPASVK